MEKPTICRYCGSPVVFTSNAEIYGREYGDGKCYLCRNCKAFVGVHPGTDTPLGTLANAELREWRKQAHYWFDQIWRKPLRITTRYKAYGVSPFHAIPYHLDTPDEPSEIIEQLCHEDGKKFIYMYYTEPDTLMHEFGTNDMRVHKNIQAIDERIKKLSQELENSLILVTADHGHMDVRYEYLEDYPDLQSLLIRESSIEHRAVNFFVKEGCHAEFVRLFNEYFSQAFILLSRQEVFDSGLFGSGTMHPQFEHSLGDYIALATSDIAINDRRLSYTLAAHHAGATQAELIVPLIVIDTDKV